MALKKLSAKRSRRDATTKGTSAAPEFDSHRFRSAEHQQRFKAIKGWSFHKERRVQLRDDEYTDFQEEIAHRHWTSLVTPMAKFDPEIVLEFYANAWPTEEGVRNMRSWVRGQWIPFDADALSQFLGDPLVLEEGQECEFSQRRNRADGFDEEAIAQLLCTPGEAGADHAHQHEHLDPDVDDIAAQQLSTGVCHPDTDERPRMPPTRHPLDPDKSNRALGFPALITGLCQSFGVPVTPSKGDAPQAADALLPPHHADPTGSLGMERYLQHLVRQQAANHRGQCRAEVAWPEDWPEAQAGEAPAGAPGDAEEARMDEEKMDLLGFLGGSGAT
ncbi:hypothetical protein GmHk_17G049649 [Glycine max]|nr:hypothetical protein GmHk_17G049649 [Glycine max]